MALRARDQKVFNVTCDGCAKETAAAAGPIEAAMLALNDGWELLPRADRHYCPRCRSLADAPVDTPLGEQIEQGGELL